MISPMWLRWRFDWLAFAIWFCLGQLFALLLFAAGAEWWLGAAAAGLVAVIGGYKAEETA